MADEALEKADEVRLEATLQTIKDVIWRLEESSEGRRSVYDVIGCLVEELVAEGVCAACIDETISGVFEALNVDTSEHTGGDSVYH